MPIKSRWLIGFFRSMAWIIYQTFSITCWERDVRIFYYNCGTISFFSSFNFCFICFKAVFLQFLCLPDELCCFHCQIFFFISGFILCLCAYVCLVIKLCPTLCQRMDCSPLGSSVLGISPGKNTKVCYHALLQGIFPTQGSNPCLLCLLH